MWGNSFAFAIASIPFILFVIIMYASGYVLMKRTLGSALSAAEQRGNNIGGNKYRQVLLHIRLCALIVSLSLTTYLILVLVYLALTVNPGWKNTHPGQVNPVVVTNLCAYFMGWVALATVLFSAHHQINRLVGLASSSTHQDVTKSSSHEPNKSGGHQQGRSNPTNSLTSPGLSYSAPDSTG